MGLRHRQNKSQVGIGVTLGFGKDPGHITDGTHTHGIDPDLQIQPDQSGDLKMGRTQKIATDQHLDIDRNNTKALKQPGSYAYISHIRLC